MATLTVGKLTTVLSDIQAKLKAPKGQTNTFGKYKYRSCEDIVEAVKPLLAEHGASLIISDEIVFIGERYYVKATATINLENEGAVATAYAREPYEKKGMDLAQLTGATSSYARKYALNGLLAIDDTKDADTQDNSESGHRFKPGEKEQIIKQVKDCLAAGDEHGLHEILNEYQSAEEKTKVWALFNSADRAAIKALMSE